MTRPQLTTPTQATKAVKVVPRVEMAGLNKLYHKPAKRKGSA
jgi:hypothetical protein